MRTFIALEMPSDFADEAAACARVLSSAVEGRFVPKEHYHLTLAFLGDADDAAVRRAMEALDEAAAEAASPLLAPVGLGRFGRPTDATLWMGLEEREELMGLATLVRERLRDQCVAFDGKTFRPHITLARRARLPKGSLPPLCFPAPARAEVVTLFKSTLDRDGATYKPLYTVRLASR